MRKSLMAGTAFAAATLLVAGGAAAADKKMMKPSITVNGYYEGVVGGIVNDKQETKYSYTPMGEGAPTAFGDPSTDPAPTAPKAKADNKMDTSALDTRTDAEIHFNGRATLDNGMKVHARVELEGQNNHSMDGSAGGDVIDEYFLSVSGSFGQIILGGTEGAAVKMLTGLSGSWATGVGETLSFDNSWIPNASPRGDGYFENLQHSRLSSGDGEKITYISPKLGGFQVGLTYEPRVANNDDNSRVNAEADRHDALHAAASYGGKFGDVGFGAGFGYMSQQGANRQAGKDAVQKNEDLSGWLAAARFDFAGIRIAGAYKMMSEDRPGKGMDSRNSSLVDVGVRYSQGANSFSVVGAHGEMKDTDAETTAMIGSYARSLGAGVKVHANLIWSKSKSDTKMGMRYGANGVPLETQTNAGLQEYSQSENSGMAVVTGIKVVF